MIRYRVLSLYKQCLTVSLKVRMRRLDQTMIKADYLKRSVLELIAEYNSFADEDEGIEPAILGVVFTMISLNRGDAIGALRPYIKNTEKLGIPAFGQKLRENKTIYADAPQYGVPVSLLQPSSPSHRDGITVTVY